jgi:superfamily I DNA/RNA helicase
VQEYVEQDASGSDLKVFVQLIDTYGAEVVIDIVDRLSPEEAAETVVSTAHKAKGREWPTVRIASDFSEPRRSHNGQPAQVPRADAMLAYVAVTRARHTLDPQGLAWVDQWL